MWSFILTKRKPFGVRIKIMDFKINRECFKPKIQKFTKNFITRPLLLFLADRGPPISPTRVT